MRNVLNALPCGLDHIVQSLLLPFCQKNICLSLLIVDCVDKPTDTMIDSMF